MMKVFNKEISQEKLDLIVSSVQEKKELENFSETSILKFANFVFKRDPKLLSFFYEKDFDSIMDSKPLKKLVKEIRSFARRIYGVYITKNYSKKDELLLNYNFSEDNLEELLKLHVSTKERLEYYSKLYLKLKELTCNPESVLDLACGLNPLSSYYLGEDIQYYASDISEKDVDFLNRFFEKAILKNYFKKGSYAFRLDLSDKDYLMELRKYSVDWCLIFKGLDPVEEISENITYDIIDSINSKWIIVSFPTVTVSRKPMKNPRRNWFEKVLDRKGLSWDTYEIPNELFYIINNLKKINIEEENELQK